MSGAAILAKKGKSAMGIPHRLAAASRVRNYKRGLAPAACVVGIGLLLSANTALAETVIYSGNNATGIQDLELDGVSYDITFVYESGYTVYGDDPPHIHLWR